MTANFAIYALGTLVLAAALHRFLGEAFLRLVRNPKTLLLVPVVFLAQRFFETLVAVLLLVLDLGGNVNNEAVIDLLGSVTEGLNFFNIKVGSAIITIYGGITALRNVTAAAKANVSMEASNAALASVFVPVSFVVAISMIVGH